MSRGRDVEPQVPLLGCCLVPAVHCICPAVHLPGPLSLSSHTEKIRRSKPCIMHVFGGWRWTGVYLKGWKEAVVDVDCVPPVPLAELGSEDLHRELQHTVWGEESNQTISQLPEHGTNA